MQAAVLEAKDQPVSIQEVPDPAPGAGQVVVRIRAAALNHRDVWIQRGQYAGLKYPIIVGSDGSGTVHQVGEGVDSALRGKEMIVNPGQQWGENERVQSTAFKILGLPEDGTFAQFLKVDAQYLIPKPAHLSFEEAAALPLAGLTAYRALFRRAGLAADEKLLITGIGGGVAMLGLQFALACGAAVYVTSSGEEKIRQACGMGAKGGVDYTQEDWVKQLQAEAGLFDVILDSAGGEGFAQLLDLAAPGGRIAVYGATRGNIPELATRKIFWKQLSILGSTMGSETDFEAMLAFVEEHQIRPVIDHVFPLAETEAALRRMEQGQQAGKIILRIE